MKYTCLYTGDDQKSYFKDVDVECENVHPLGKYSNHFPVKVMLFRDFEKGSLFDWHNAPQPQYIVYLEGEVEVEASGGESRIFRQCDILFATDVTGKGHITKTLSKGRSAIVVTG